MSRTDTQATPDDDRSRIDTLRAQLELLEEENRRLREEYADAIQPQYRRTAIALGCCGVVSFVAAVFVPPVRSVLIAIGAIGVYAAILTHALTPERFIAASVGERVYATLATNYEAVVGDLGLTGEQVYVPTESETNTSHLFVPQYEEYTVPPAAALGDPFVVTETESERGISVRPIGAGLYDEFERALPESPAAETRTLTEQLTEALTQQFELVESASFDLDETQLRVEVTNVAYGKPTRLDHPVVSFLAVGIAHGVDAPVTVETTEGNDRVDYFILLTWSRR